MKPGTKKKIREEKQRAEYLKSTSSEREYLAGALEKIDAKIKTPYIQEHFKKRVALKAKRLALMERLKVLTHGLP